MNHTLRAVFEPGIKMLTISGSLVAMNELEHEQLAALLDEKDVPEVSVEFKNVNDVLSVSIKFTHEKDIAAHGHTNLSLRREARDRGMSVDDVVADREAKAKAAKAAKKKNANGPE